MSSIEWTNETWNPIVGCSIVSPGCTNCYAMTMARRLAANPATPHYAGTVKTVNGNSVWTGEIGVAGDDVWARPLRWATPRTIFVNSMGDLFAENVTDDQIDRTFAVMALTPQHTYQVLTKRPERMRDYMMAAPFGRWWCAADIVACDINLPESHPGADYLLAGQAAAVNSLPNVWLGVSAERQEEADKRIPLLLETPAAVRFVSAEPLLGPIDFTSYLIGHEEHGIDWSREVGSKVGACIGWTPPLDWIIVGGESGPGARAMRPEWARAIRDDCAAAGVPFFFKQWGGWAPLDRAAVPDTMFRCTKKVGGRLLDGRAHDAMPET